MRLYPLFEEDGEIGGYTPEAAEASSEPSSVTTEDYEPSGDGNAPTPTTDDQQASVDQSKAFARRLRESTEKAIAEERAKWEQESREREAQLSYLDKQAQIYGYKNRQEYMEGLDQYLKKQQMEQEAQRMGVDPDVYAQYFAPVTTEVAELRQKLQTYEQQQADRQQQQAKQQQWTELYTAYPGLVESSASFDEGRAPEWFNSDMQRLIGMGYQPVHAYELAHKDTLFRQKEQEVLARVTGRDGKQILPSNDQPNNVQFDPANMSMEQIQELSRRAQRGERIVL